MNRSKIAACLHGLDLTFVKAGSLADIFEYVVHLSFGKATICCRVGTLALGRRLIQEEVVVSLAIIVELSHCQSVLQELLCARNIYTCGGRLLV
jgi:hypothetical protein